MKITITADEMKRHAIEWVKSQLHGEWEVSEISEYSYFGDLRLLVENKVNDDHCVLDNLECLSVGSDQSNGHEQDGRLN